MQNARLGAECALVGCRPLRSEIGRFPEKRDARHVTFLTVSLLARSPSPGHSLNQKNSLRKLWNQLIRLSILNIPILLNLLILFNTCILSILLSLIRDEIAICSRPRIQKSSAATFGGPPDVKSCSRELFETRQAVLFGEWSPT